MLIGTTRLCREGGYDRSCREIVNGVIVKEAMICRTVLRSEKGHDRPQKERTPVVEVQPDDDLQPVHLDQPSGRAARDRIVEHHF
ncbi:hypothetical protein QQF64_008929 [Cirrhinus molitorella]|uniref:Uncharacterized protein n=1 Tax=Cirrhinus molitorella TaxID=172907 RepID=A0ABR3MB04_9TELE